MPSTTDAEPAPARVSAPPSGADGYRRLTLHARTAEAAVAITVAHHTGRSIAEAAVTIARRGRQDTLSVSARHPCLGAVPPGRRETVEPHALEGPSLPAVIGCIRLDPLVATGGTKLVADGTEAAGIAADLTWEPLATPLDIPANPYGPDAEVRTLPLPQRLVRVHISGTVTVDGDEIDLGGAIGWVEAATGLHPPSLALMAPALTDPRRHLLRAVVPTGEGLVHVLIDENSDARYLANAVGEASGTCPQVSRRIGWRPGTRWPVDVGFGLRREDGAVLDVDIDLTSGLPLAARALGSADPLWPEGNWHDEVALGRSSWDPDALDPLDVHNLHRFTWGTTSLDGETVPVLLESIAVGPDLPGTDNGLTGFADGFAG